MQLKERMSLAGRCLLAGLNPQHDWMPTGGYEAAHDTGRWWDAMLRLEAVTGFTIPADLEGAMLRNLHTLTEESDGLLMNRPDVPWLQDKARINPHNFRESMLAYHALVRYRGSAWARQMGHRLLQTMDRCLCVDGRLDFTSLSVWGKVPPTADPSHSEAAHDAWFDATATSGRSLEAIVWFYQSTGDALALQVANRIAQFHLAQSTNPDGSMRAEIVDPQNVGHSHSYLGTLRGLLLFGLLTGQREYVERVSRTYRNGVQSHVITTSGWTAHDLGRQRFSDRLGNPVPETASCGDVAQLALWLARDAGEADLWDDVERLVRCRLFPAQVTEADARPDAPVEARTLGGWGVHGLPHGGKNCVFDVAAAVLHTLTDIHSAIALRTSAGLQVCLHFSHENEWLKIESTRAGSEAQVTVHPKTSDNLLIRVPGWAPRESLQLVVNDQPVPVNMVGPFALVGRSPLGVGANVTLRYALPERYTSEQTRMGQSYRFMWRGDEIAGADPSDAPLPFYPALSGGDR